MWDGSQKGENPSALGKNKIQWITDLPASLRGRVILGKGNRMEELIKRLERVIATGAPDKDGLHPISAETVLEVVKQLSEHGTNCISRQAAIRWVKTECNPYGKPTLDFESGKKVIEHLEQMPPAQPEPCEDAVSRAEILRMINCINDHHAITPYKSVGAVTEHLTRIASNLPLVTPKQPERQTGKWIYQMGMIKCDQCLRAIRRIDHDGLLNFCPNCGADMREVTE